MEEWKKKIETCQKYANILTALSDEDMLIAGGYQWKYGNRGRSHCPVSHGNGKADQKIFQSRV